MSLSWVEATRLAAKGGPADRLRRWLVVLCAALAAMVLTAAATVPSQMKDGVLVESVLGRLISDSGLVVGVAAALVVVAVPVIHLATQVVRVGAPARDRRLEGIRSAGGTRGDVRRVVQAEATVWSCLGAGIGVVAFYAFMLAAPRLLRVEYADFGPDIGAYGADMVAGTEPVISLAVWPNPLVIVAAAALVPVVAALVLPLVTSKVAGAPRASNGRPMSRSLAVSLLGSVAVALVSVFALAAVDGGSGLARDLIFVVLALATATFAVSLLASTATGVSIRLGRTLVGRGQTSALLAGRRMQANPHLATNTSVSLVLVGLIGGIAVPLESLLETDRVRNATENGWDSVASGGRLSREILFYTVPTATVQALAAVVAAVGAIGLLIAVAEQVSMRGPDLARQVAAGVPRAVLRRAFIIEAAVPAAVMSSAALAIGAAIPVLSVLLTGEAAMLGTVAWERLVGLWVILVGGVVVAAWLGSLALASSAAPQRIRDRE